MWHFSVQLGDTHNVLVCGCLPPDHASVRRTVRHWYGTDLCTLWNSRLPDLRQVEEQAKSFPRLCQ